MFPGGEADRVDQAVQTVPTLCQLSKCRVDLLVAADVERQHDVGTKLRCEPGHPLPEFFSLVGESEFRTFAMHCLGDTVGNRAIARDTDDQCAFVV